MKLQSGSWDVFVVKMLALLMKLSTFLGLGLTVVVAKLLGAPVAYIVLFLLVIMAAALIDIDGTLDEIQKEIEESREINADDEVG